MYLLSSIIIKMMIVKNVLLSVLMSVCAGNDIFHDLTKVNVFPREFAEYFGYSVLLTDKGLTVGAPKAKNEALKNYTTGLVFQCKLSNIADIQNFTQCTVMGMERGYVNPSSTIRTGSFYRNDMWFGATIAWVAEHKFLSCAPRWANPYNDRHLLANGACYAQTTTRGKILMPLSDKLRQAFIITDNKGRDFGQLGDHLNLFAYGQAGMSVKVTGNTSVIIGAPGVMQWSGAIIEYKYIPDDDVLFFSKQPSVNPYFTLDLGPNNYFGYSVESGIFEKNGKILYVAGAPRSKSGYGQVLIFEPSIQEMEPLNIKAKVKGPHLGSYFGASLCCTDLDGDGQTDLLVGAPSFIKRDGDVTYDQGAVFIYMAVGENPGFSLEPAGFVSGLDKSGARFGTAIADLGDIDSDGYTDIAIGAPWEDDGTGAVYIYRGTSSGLRSQFVQRITTGDTKSFGFSIAKGYDIDKNNCNDLAVGAPQSGKVFIFRSAATILVNAVIKVPNAMDLQQNATNFTTIFCADVPKRHFPPQTKIDLQASITVDTEQNRAWIAKDLEFVVTVEPGINVCFERVVEVKPTADLSKPISVKYSLKDVDLATDDPGKFKLNPVRLSEDSNLHASLDIQLTRGCGEDLICKPKLKLFLETFGSPHIPGTQTLFGVNIRVLNEDEPSYGAKVLVHLPLVPKRVPRECTLKVFNMTCKVPSPLYKTNAVSWDIELEFDARDNLKEKLHVSAALIDPLEDGSWKRNVTILVTPQADFRISGKALPNTTVTVTRDKFNEAGFVSFAHFYEVTNIGPSDWYHLSFEIDLPDMVSFSTKVEDCVLEGNNTMTSPSHVLSCTRRVPAKKTFTISLPFRLDLDKYGNILEENTSLNVTSKILLYVGNYDRSIALRKIRYVSSVIVLDPALPLWPPIVGVLAGLLILAAIVYGLHKRGFFSRQKREDLRRLQDDADPLEDPEPTGSSRLPDLDESTLELLNDDSD